MTPAKLPNFVEFDKTTGTMHSSTSNMTVLMLTRIILDPLSNVKIDDLKFHQLSRLDGDTFEYVRQYGDGDDIMWFVCGGLYHFLRLGLHTAFRPDEKSVKKFIRFLTRAGEMYNRNNPFHNAIHALDVATSAVNILARNQKLMEACTPPELLAVLIAALCHDLEHPARTNAFLISTRHKLSIRYNDRSVLENYHASRMFETLLEDSDTNGGINFVFDWIDEEVFPAFRELIIRMIIATDMVRIVIYVVMMIRVVISNYRVI